MANRTEQLGIKITADANGVNAEIEKVIRNVNKLGATGQTAAKNLQRTTQATQSMGSAAIAASQALSALGVSFSIVQLGKIADAYANIQARIKLVSGSAAELATANRELFRISQENLSPLQETASMYARIAQSIADMGRSQKDALAVTDLVGKTLRISGASAAEASSAILQFGQALGSGVLQGEELKAILESSPRLAKALADALNVTTGQLKAMGAAGELTSRQVVDALLSQGDKIKREYGQIPTTIGAAFTQLENAFTRYIGNADQATGSSRKFAESISQLADNLPRILDGMSKFGNGVINLMNAIGNTFDFVSEKFSALERMIQKVPLLGSAIDRSKAAGADPFDLPRKPNAQPPSNYTTGGGFGGDESFFNGVAGGLSKTAQQYINAANAAWKLTAAQKQVVETIVRIGDAKGFDPAFLLSIARAETRLGELNRVSSAGAKGVFQFMDGTAKRFGVKDPWNLEQATNGAIQYLGKLKSQFKSVGLAAAGYNAGEGNVQKYGGVPPFKETQTYVRRVLQNMRDLQQAMGTSTEDLGKEIQKAEKDQYQSYVDHLKSRESAFEDYSKKAIAEQRTMMERLNAAQQDAEQKAKAAMAGGDLTAIRAAEAQQRKFLEDKKALLLQGIAIEEEATRKKIANIGMEIAQAQKLNQYEGVDKLRQQRSSELAELAALAERRKQIEIGAQADISKAASQFEDDRRQAQRQAADDNVRMIEEQRQANEDAYRQMQQVMELRMSEAANLADARKQDIDNQVEAARAETAAAQASRQASLEGLSGIEAQQKAREILNANLRDTLDLIDLEKTKALEKLVIDGDILASQRQLLEVYREIAEQQGNKDQALAIEKQLQDVYAGQAKNIRDRVKAQSEAAAKAAKAEVDASKQTKGMDTQDVRESQLRMNAFWDQYMGRLNDYSTTWAQITGETENGFSRITIAMGEYAKQIDQIGSGYDEMRKKFGESDLLNIGEGLAQAQAALNAMAKTMIALRSNYKEGTKGYADMTAAAERMMEVQRALQVVEGVLGVIHQFTAGDPYTAIPRALGVAAMIASMGVSTGASGGMTNGQAKNATQSGGYTAAGGGVFGDPSAQSDSISKALDIVAENSSADLAYSASMLRALTDIKFALMGTTNAIIRGVGPEAVSGLGTQPLLGKKTLGGFDPIGGLLGQNDILGKFLFNVTKKITNWGIKALPQSLDQVISEGFKGMNWTEVTKTTKVLGITIGKSVKNYYSTLDAGVTGQITRVILSMADTVKEAGKAFKISGDQFTGAMKDFVVNFGTLSTKGLKGQELQDAVQAVFSSMSDDMAQQFQSRFDLGLEPFMQAGEGMFQTLVRVANGINTATGILAQFGMEAINYQQIVQKQGDVAAEIVRQSIVAFEGVGSAIGAYVDQAVGTAEELMSVYRDLLIVSDVAKLAGFNLADLSDALIVTSGGVAKFLENLTTYQTEILGSSDYARQMLTLTREFSKLGLAVPKNNDAFVMLVDSINTSTEAGQKLYAQILSLASAFSKAQQAAAQLEELRAKYLPTDSLKAYRDQINQVATDFKQIIEGSMAALPGGTTYLKRTTKIGTLTNRIEDRSDQRALIQEEITALEAKQKLTLKEKQRLALLRQQRKDLNDEIAGYQKQIDDIDKLIAKNPKTKALLEERAKLIEEQGDAVIKTLADIWDSMTTAINNAKETLKSIQDSIFELAGGAGGETIKLGLANARRISAEAAYNAYSGNDITKLNTLSDAYYKAIMDEYQARMDLINAPKDALEKERELQQKAHDEQIAALEKELGVTQELFDAILNIQQYVKNLRLSTASTLSPKALLDQAQSDFESTLKKAQGGDVQAMRDITGASDAYLEAAKKYFGSGGRYGDIFDNITTALDKLGLTDVGDAQTIQDKIDQLNKDHEVYLKSIDDQIAALKIDEQLRSLQDETSKKLQMLADDLGPRITSAEKQAQADMKILIDETIKTNGFNQRQLDALNEMLSSWGMSTVANPVTTEPSILSPTDPWVQSIFDNWLKTQTGYQNPVPAFALGGTASGLALVGEKGPELVNFERPAQVMTAEETRSALTEGPKTFKALEEIKREIRALVTTQSGANPQLITELQALNRRMDSIERQQRIRA